MAKVKKSDFRQRAHVNPFKNTDIFIPESPESIKWSNYFSNGEQPRYLDIGCGYGRFLMSVGKKNKDINILGMEIRHKVCEYVLNRIKEQSILNVSAVKTNSMIFLVNFFKKSSLEKIFILFPDPYFKKRKHKCRIVNKQLVPVFHYLLVNKGRLYISTDVKTLFDDMCSTIESSGLFNRITAPEMDPLYELTYKDTDEALRAGVKTGSTYAAIYET